MRKFFGLTMLGWLNYLIIQFFFMRICYWENMKGEATAWGLLLGPAPLTGWNYKPYKTIFRPRTIWLWQSASHRSPTGHSP